MNTQRKKYIIVLLITAGIFIVVFGLVNYLDQNRNANIDDLQRKITADLIATETQFELLKNAPCKSIDKSILSRELNELGAKLSFAESTQGISNPNVVQLKKYYSLLQVKDYLLMREVQKTCDLDTEFILYFYQQDCDECRRQGYVLTKLKEEYPSLRIYSFDRNLEFPVIETFISLYDIKDIYPSLIVNDELQQGFQSSEALEALLPELVAQKELDKKIAQGISFILSQDAYTHLKHEDLSFSKENKGIFEYTVVNGKEKEEQKPELIKVVFDKVTGMAELKTE